MENHGIWTEEEHDRFLEAMKKYPHGPWRAVAQFIGTRSARQVQTHAQKLREKMLRRQRGLKRVRCEWTRRTHRIESENLVNPTKATTWAVTPATASKSTTEGSMKMKQKAQHAEEAATATEAMPSLEELCQFLFEWVEGCEEDATRIV